MSGSPIAWKLKMIYGLMIFLVFLCALKVYQDYKFEELKSKSVLKKDPMCCHIDYVGERKIKHECGICCPIGKAADCRGWDDWFTYYSFVECKCK